MKRLMEVYEGLWSDQKFKVLGWTLWAVSMLSTNLLGFMNGIEAGLLAMACTSALTCIILFFASEMK